MKIALFLDSRGAGGIETHVAQLSRGLLAYGIPFEIVFFKRYQEAHPFLVQLKGEVKIIDLKGSIKKLSTYLKSERPLLHTHGYKAGILGRIFATIHNIHVVSTHHNGDPGRGKIYLYNLLDRFTALLSKNICVSNDIMTRVPGNKTLIPNFIDFPKTNSQHRCRYQVAFVGRFSHEKGPDKFVEIAKNMPYQFAMYGDGPLRNTLQSEHPHIKMYGNVNMSNHWSKIRVLVIPSRYEGLPLAALEALSHGIPVICSKTGGLPELIKNAGIGNSIPLKDVDSFRDRIEFWMNTNNSRYELNALRARKYIFQNYSLSACIPPTLAIYRSTSSAG